MADITTQLTSIQKSIDKLSKDMDKRFEQVDKRFEQVDNRFEKIPTAISQLFAIEVEEIIDRKLDEKLGTYPTKDKYYHQTAQLMGEIKATREDQIMLTSQVQRHSDAIEKLEKLHTDSNPHLIRS